MNPAKSHVSLSMRSLYDYIFFFLSIQHLKVFRKYWFKSMWIVLFYTETMDFGVGVREVFLAKCQDNQKFQQNGITPGPEIRALPLTLENPELDFQGLICPSIKTASVSLCPRSQQICTPASSPWDCWVWSEPFRTGVLQNSFLLHLSFGLVTFLPSLKPKIVHLVPRN